jgi:hypothetical protein
MTKTGHSVPSEQVSALTSIVWQVTQEQPMMSLRAIPEIGRIIDGSADAWTARQLLAFVRQVEALEPSERRVFTASIDEVQIRSKLWLIDELASRCRLDGVTMVVLGAWYGILPWLMGLRLERPPARVVCVDLSTEAVGLGRRVLGPLCGNVVYLAADAMELNYAGLARQPSPLLVNTICEHLADAPSWWARVPAGQLSVLQSNNYGQCREHVNCVDDVEQMTTQTPMSELLFQGVLQLPIFDRFMLIGYR